MKRTILAVAVVAGLADASPAQAQFVVGPVYGGGIVTGRGFGFSVHRHHFRAFGFAGGFSSRSVFGFAPVLPPFSTITPFGFSPGFIGPGWGAPPVFGWNPVWGTRFWGPSIWGPPVWGPQFWGPGWDGFFPPQPPVFVVPPPIILAGNNGFPNGNAGDANARVIPRDDDPRPAPINRANFLVIEPKKPAAQAALPQLPPPGQIVPIVDRVAKVDPILLLPPAPRFDPFAEPRRAEKDVADPDPVKEAARLVKLGREAFARGAYGKAAERFDRATIANPKLAEPHFLKAQAAFAAGSYADAVAAIRAGLALDPAWPASVFDPKEPYGVEAALFATHLAELRKTVAANPREPMLEFLLGYQLWFVGEKAEAKKWFAAAQSRPAAPEVIARFK